MSLYGLNPGTPPYSSSRTIGASPKALGEVIEAQGLRYRIARDGRTGVQMARDKDQRPTGIILDVMLPDIDGWTVMQELRADPASARIPVHFVSAVDAPEHGASLGAVGYLTKPATRRDLVRVIQSLAPDSGRRKCRILVVEKDTGRWRILGRAVGGREPRSPPRF